MKYENAKDILPEALLREIQKYASGKLLYIPSGSVRKAWGEESGARADLHSRNHEIRTRYAMGISPETLAEDYFLAPETIKKIVYRKEKSMNTTKFPEKMFAYQITETGGEIPEIVCEEHPGFGVIPRVGEKEQFAIYRQPEGVVQNIVHAEAVSEWEIHGERGVRIDIREAGLDGVAVRDHFVVAQLTKDGIKNLAEGGTWDGITHLHTFLEGEDFIDRMGGVCPTRLKPEGLIRKNGSCVTVSDPSVISDVVGKYRVTMNGKEYDTVLVINTEDPEQVVTESYIGMDGHTVLFRQFITENLAVQLQGSSEVLTVNGRAYYHAADCIRDSVC